MNKVKLIILCISIFSLIITYLLNNAFNELNFYNKFITLTIIINISILLVLLIKTTIGMIKNELIKNVLLTITSTTFLLLIIETIFIFIPRSHFFNNTLASKNWKLYYENPINEFGYHDVKPLKKKKTILFVGDSFTQGHGIKNIEDRFSNRLSALAPYISTINIGKNGLDTKKEYVEMVDFIKKSKIKPNVIVLQYFGNDIEAIAYEKMKKINHDPYSNLPKTPKFIIKGSYLINYLYWLYPHEDYKPYLTFLTNAYSKNEIFNEHISDLYKFVSYCKSNNIQLKLILFPFLTDPSISKKIYENKIAFFFKNKNVSVLKVSELIKNIEKNECIVNSNDSHASIKVNKLISEKLFNELK